VSNITQLDTKPDDLKALIERIKRVMDDQLELDALLAKINRAKFLVLVKEGFTDEQALKIIMGPAR
jgi:Flp pilus assembly CpaE family ATPase